MNTATLVIPCYNEATRLDHAAMLALVNGRPGLKLLFVNDGSTDATLARLTELTSRRPDRLDLRSLPRNAGKAEAVRQGLQAALAGPADVVGYFDADLSTPGGEILRLLEIIDERPVEVVLGARVALLGTDIQRQPARHYLGRVFASVASLLLGVRVYDTQCGAKLLRRSPALSAALATPFLSRWAFDVELLGRLLAGAPGTPALAPEGLLEVPLAVWRDVPGSKLRPADMANVLRDLTLIGVDLRRRRRAATV